MLSPEDITALFNSLRLAGISTIILVILATPLAYWLARSRRRVSVVAEAVLSLPLVLPPTVLGFYLLLLLGSGGFLGRISILIGGRPLAFSFAGLVIGSVVYSLPFVVQPLKNAFAAVDEGHIEAAATLRADGRDRFFTVIVPMSRSGFFSAAALAFAHTLGEFGIVLMIGGNIPGKTRMASIAIYEHVESLEYARAHLLSAILIALSLVLLIPVYARNRRGLL